MCEQGGPIFPDFCVIYGWPFTGVCGIHKNSVTHLLGLADSVYLSWVLSLMLLCPSLTDYVNGICRSSYMHIHDLHRSRQHDRMFARTPLI